MRAQFDREWPRGAPGGEKQERKEKGNNVWHRESAVLLSPREIYIFLSQFHSARATVLAIGRIDARSLGTRCGGHLGRLARFGRGRRSTRRSAEPDLSSLSYCNLIASELPIRVHGDTDSPRVDGSSRAQVRAARPLRQPRGLRKAVPRENRPRR